MPRSVSLRLLGCIATALALVGFSASALAQRRPRTPPTEVEAEAPPTQADSAMRFFELATEEYRTGRYIEAATHLEQALILDPEEPVLLFNLGRVYELMNRHDDAMDCFQRLLAVTPEDAAEDRARTEEAIARIRGARERAIAAEVERAARNATPERVTVRQAGVADEAFWATMIAGAAVSLAAGAVGVVGLLQRESLAARPLSVMFPYEQYRLDREATLLLANVADITGAVGAATIATALLLFGLRESEVEVPVSVAPSSSGLQLIARGTF